jgi:hypothetical protein
VSGVANVPIYRKIKMPQAQVDPAKMLGTT